MVLFYSLITYWGKEDILNNDLPNDPDRNIYLPIWVHLYEDDNLSDFCDDGFFRFNLSCTTTEKGLTLWGFYGERLFKVDPDWNPSYAPKYLKNFHLKNFRLRELMKISKAKK